MLELKVALGALLRRFELRPTTPELPSPVRRGILLSPKGGGRIRLAARPGADGEAGRASSRLIHPTQGR
jgi:cytochrome P450